MRQANFQFTLSIILFPSSGEHAHFQFGSLVSIPLQKPGGSYSKFVHSNHIRLLSTELHLDLSPNTFPSRNMPLLYVAVERTRRSRLRISHRILFCDEKFDPGGCRSCDHWTWRQRPGRWIMNSKYVYVHVLLYCLGFACLFRAPFIPSPLFPSPLSLSLSCSLSPSLLLIFTLFIFSLVLLSLTFLPP